MHFPSYLAAPTDRKVRCDLRVPSCCNCSEAGRQCLGYGFRLFWPRNEGGRRALVHTPLRIDDGADGDEPVTDLIFLNTSTDDVRLSYQLSEFWSTRELPALPSKIC